MSTGKSNNQEVTSKVIFGDKEISITLVSQRYSDLPQIDVECRISFPGFPLLYHSVFLADRNNAEQKCNLRTVDDREEDSIREELRIALDNIIRSIECGYGMHTCMISQHIREACLKKKKWDRGAFLRILLQ